jgi:hypothetical protein
MPAESYAAHDIRGARGTRGVRGTHTARGTHVAHAGASRHVALVPTNPQQDALRAAAASPDVTVFIDPVDGTRLITIHDAARLTGVKPRAVYRWIQTGRVAVRKLAGNQRMRVVLASLWEAAT